MSKSLQTASNSNTLSDRQSDRRASNSYPLTVPDAKAVSSNQHFATSLTTISDELISMVRESFPNCQPGDVLLAVFLSYMARIGENYSFDLGYADSELIEEAGNLEDLFAVYISCHIEIDLEQTFATIFDSVREQIESAKKDRSSTLNLATSDPILNSLPGSEIESLFPVAVKRVSNLEDSSIQQTLGQTLTFIVPDDGKSCSWQYNSEILEPDSIDRMWGQLTTLLESIVRDSQQPIAQLALLPEVETRQVVENCDRIDAESDKCIQELFEAQVERTPDAVAVEYRDRQLTYRQLNQQANQLAHYLRDLGVAPEVLVGFCIDRSLETIVGLLAVLKAGGAYVPLDPTYPAERLAYMVEDAQISVLLTRSKLRDRLPEHQAQVVDLDSGWSEIASRSSENPAIENTSENLAYVIYTSGSTGKPKGVTITHSALSCFAQTVVTEYEIVASDRLLQFASINFDTAVEEIFPSLLAGSKLVLRTDNMIGDFKTFCRACQDLQLTVLNLPTAYWHRLVNELVSREVDLPDSLRLVIIGGEKVLSEPVKSWQKYLIDSGRSDLQLINSYGPTETTVSATLYRIFANTPIIGEVPIGRPFPHLQAYILDRDRQPVASGIPGELYLSGESLARGYLNRPELTAERFCTSDEATTRLYKTGDLVRYLADGNIEYIGRIDKQVKIRGFRIELGEIETAIVRYPNIQQTAVIAREDTPGDKRLVAYIVPREEFQSSELRSFLAERLPKYMMPVAYVKLDELPITPSGKIDYRALPSPDWNLSELETTAIAPRNELEEKLAEIWSQVLKISPIGVEDNFFDLGGHSLLAVSLLTQIEKTFKKNIPLATFLSAPTVSGLAGIISQESATSDSLLFAIRTKGSKPPLFLINAMGTGMLAYKLLTKYLDPERPVYGIRAIGMDDSRIPQNRIEQMAQTYIKEMRSVQPQGPYFVAGVCTGGTIAFEIASQLNSCGSKVEFLGLIDSTARPILDDSENEAVVDTPPTFFDRYIKHNFVLRGLNNLFGVIINPQLKLRDKLSFTADMLQQLANKIGYKLETITYRGDEQRLPYTVRRSRVFDAGVEALRHYTPKAYQGSKVVLIRANDNPEHIHHNYQLGWDEFVTDGLEVYEVSADQTTLLFEPHIHTLAAKLNSCLENISR